MANHYRTYQTNPHVRPVSRTLFIEQDAHLYDITRKAAIVGFTAVAVLAVALFLRVIF